jgi:regulator of replication initiation timing
VIAQEVETVYPDLVDTDAKGMKSVNYTGFVGPLIEAVKELKTQNDALKAENAELKARLAAIEKKLGL